MDETLQTHLLNLRSEDLTARTQAYFAALAVADQPVDWAYQAWDGVVADLRHPDNHIRSLASQLLSSLALSDPQQRMLRDFPALLAVTRDARFVTARHCLQSLWKVGLAGAAQRKMLLDGLSARFRECHSEKNCTLIRYDIIVDLRKLYEQTSDETVRELALALIETEDDLKYRKKYAGVWR